MAAAAAPTPASSPLSGFARWVPSLPIVNLNSLNPFATSDNTKPSSGEATGRSFLSILNNGTTNDASASRETSPTRSNIMFEEPHGRINSEDGDSREGSLADERTSRRRTNKLKTTFSLHRLSPDARPTPALEVIPSANFSVRLTKAITKVFRAKHGLCPNDFVVLRAEKYAGNDDVVDEEQETRDIIGLICNRRKETKEEGMVEKAKVKICLATGMEWEAYPLINGGYEFFTTDEHGLGLTMRWVPKKNKDGSKALSKDGTRRFNFSTISPNTRRHPVIAVLSKTGVDIYDTYKMPDPNASTPTPTPTRNSSSVLADAMEEEGAGNDMCDTDDSLREIIAMTAIWVTFKEGWSPTFRYDDKEAGVAPQRAASGMSAPYSPTKSNASPMATPPGSPTHAQLEKRGSIKSVGSNIFRRTSMLSRDNRMSQTSLPEEYLESTGLERAGSVKKTGRARGDSTSTVLVHRAASNRRKNNQQATWRPDLLAQQNSLTETSREDMHTAATPTKVTARPDSIWDSPAEAASEGRKESAAQPLIPIPTTTTPGESAPPSPSTNRTAPRTLEAEKPAEKRISDATTEASSSASVPQISASQQQKQQVKQGKEKGKKKRSWRKLFCGVGGDYDGL
ncbi:hypothetical protein LTR78_004196 [Recurvomyces mirabilis]|uniref:Uncharacterized protein n=1 Tax=Recurvomyces mirabilis TaxID=574656 RepID=A0AAE1C2X9_9PEZI|nr:hypothetical protein LTR78_004196 [Recurvomyces mirabilis]